MAKNPWTSTLLGIGAFVAMQNISWMIDAYTWYTHVYEAPFEINIITLARDASCTAGVKLRSYCLAEGKLSDYYPEFAVDAIHDACSGQEEAGIVYMAESDAIRVNNALNTIVRSEVRGEDYIPEGGEMVYALTHFGDNENVLNGKRVTLMVTSRSTMEVVAKLPHDAYAKTLVQERNWRLLHELKEEFDYDLLPQEEEEAKLASKRLERESFIQFVYKRYSFYGLIGFPYYGENVARERRVPVKGVAHLVEE
eukprot:CAMPEP_0167772464 /NCGR_PEP_ID=MMETSP0111_2-20121227/862_1 /TAXON_ID=91324 /ORGANISM="Lotharella globosa, Strain CCCM811" /LENGTH=252 /DNA_ID=CAMNT_0007661959 /DNA_START=8 /DNA_END=766 /DNA_ORIENTATION=+